MNRPGVPGAGVTAVIPLRDGASGKSRLASVLDDDARRALITVLAQHVVGTLLATPQVDRVMVVTADVRFAGSALGELSDVGDLEFLAQPPDRPGLNGALDAARDVFGAGTPETGPDRPRSLLIAHADLPALTPADITDLVMRSTGGPLGRFPERPSGRHPADRSSPDRPQQADRSDHLHPADRTSSDRPHPTDRTSPDRPRPADVVIATDRVGRGTNLLLLGARGMERGFRFRFGPDSRDAHEAEAARLGLRAVTISRPGTAVDLDTVDDWNELPPAVRTAVGRYARFPAT